MNARLEEGLVPADRHTAVREYYGRILKSKNDLRTSACCSAETPPGWLQRLMAAVPEEIRERFYGCGSPIPLALEDRTVLDLGCGTGRDCYLLAQLTGSSGRVIGLDMTGEQLDVARRHVAAFSRRLGLPPDVLEFRQGYIEALDAAGIADASVDAVVSNCVINLSPDKEAVFREIRRVLKPGGELYFSDVFCDRRLPAGVQTDAVLVGECLGGALYTEDFRRLMGKIGFEDVRSVRAAAVTVTDEKLAEKLGNARFVSRTLRAFKLPLEDRCEDYGQVAVYRGTLARSPAVFELDDHHRFERRRPLTVCGNTADMLQKTRYAPHFEVIGDRREHHGLYACGAGSETQAQADGGACCA
ncbi:MAG: methyltransferase domain-containing protein [Gammaproteobacteria bacterium]|nr:methyltransferase domain-containing protein [Gammaproteobacteria bacterium]